MKNTKKERMFVILLSNKGETIGEVLAALLIVVMAVTMLAGAIMAAGRVNKAADNSKQSFKTDAKESADAVVIFELDGVTDTAEVEMIEGSGGYAYYVQKP